MLTGEHNSPRHSMKKTSTSQQLSTDGPPFINIGQVMHANSNTRNSSNRNILDKHESVYGATYAKDEEAEINCGRYPL